MYKKVSDFPYAEGCYMIMPVGLPERFYPTEADRKHTTKNYVICFNKNTPNDIKQRFIKDYAEYYAKEKASGIFR